MDNRTIEQRFTEIEQRVSHLEMARSPLHIAHAGSSLEKKVSAREFLMTKELKSEAQKTLALGYYLEHVEGVPSFNIGDLASVFQMAKEKRPKNISDAANKNVVRGFFMEVAEKKDSKKAWTLTSTGERCVEVKLASK